jgi:peptidoglycan hydrolase-like protein with peptidoglycan-binding domain
MRSSPTRPTRGLSALAVAGVLTAAGLSGCHSSSPATSALRGSGTATTVDASASLAAGATPGSSTTVAPTTTTRPVTTTSPAPSTTVPSGQIGSSGPAALQLQQSLSALGYWLGTPDGKFGGTTQQAVWALQKAAGLPRTGVLDAATAAALAAGTVPKAQSTSGHVIEVDLARGILLFVTNGHVDNVLNTSTGGGYVYYDQGVRNVALTPKGHFATSRVIDGQHKSSLGLLFRPRFFVGGFAIHGDSYVPPKPVSHGCVRVTNAAIDWIWSSGNDAIGTPVWVY